MKDDKNSYSSTLYYLGFAYAKLGRLPEAKAVLNEAVTVEGPAQDLSRKLLVKVNEAKPTVRRTK